MSSKDVIMLVHYFVWAWVIAFGTSIFLNEKSIGGLILLLIGLFMLLLPAFWGLLI